MPPRALVVLPLRLMLCALVAHAPDDGRMPWPFMGFIAHV